MSPGASTVFICHDHMMDPLLAAIGERLQASGVAVVRGRQNLPGEVISYSAAECAELFAAADVAMFSSRSRCSRAVMEAAPRLRAIVNPSIGVETIDIGAASALDILVVNGSTPENYIGMAEASVMLMLNLMLGLRASEAVMAGSRPRPAPEHRHARTLRGKTVGLIGWGHIGRAVASRLAAFDVELLVHSQHATAVDVPPGVRLVGLETLLRSSDIVGVFAAIHAGNRGMIDAQALRLMKSAAFLVNVSRGDAVDEPALIAALEQGWIAGAALDTFAVEPLPRDSRLRSMPNVILTPHMVGQTRESYAAALAIGVQNVLDVLAGTVPTNCRNVGIAPRWQQRCDGLDRPVGAAGFRI